MLRIAASLGADLLDTLRQVLGCLWRISSYSAAAWLQLAPSAGVMNDA